MTLNYQMESFTASNGKKVSVVPGFRESILNYRPSSSPRMNWTSERFADTAKKKIKRFDRLVEDLRRFCSSLEGASLLDVGCGDATNSILAAKRLNCNVTGIDLDVQILSDSVKGELSRRLCKEYFPGNSFLSSNDFISFLGTLPLRLFQMNAASMNLPDGSMDIIISRSAMEHIQPIDMALEEFCRVLRPGGIMYLMIDPYYWVRGCHKRGVIDIPFAHARLALQDYYDFVMATEGRAVAEERTNRLSTLNSFTTDHWRSLFESMSAKVLEFRTSISDVSSKALKDNPCVLDSLLAGVSLEDLTSERIIVVLERL